MFGSSSASHLQACVGGGGGDQFDDDLMADERFAAPVLRDEREQAVLDLVPLAGAGRQMTDGDGNAELVGQRLAIRASTSATRDTVAATTVGGDQKACRVG